jgi:hypothetical protein
MNGTLNDGSLSISLIYGRMADNPGATQIRRCPQPMLRSRSLARLPCVDRPPDPALGIRSVSRAGEERETLYTLACGDALHAQLDFQVARSKESPHKSLGKLGFIPAAAIRTPASHSRRGASMSIILSASAGAPNLMELHGFHRVRSSVIRPVSNGFCKRSRGYAATSGNAARTSFLAKSISSAEIVCERF